MPIMSAYDPETVELLRSVLDEAWTALPPRHQRQISKTQMAGHILKHAPPVNVTRLDFASGLLMTPCRNSLRPNPARSP